MAEARREAATAARIAELEALVEQARAESRRATAAANLARLAALEIRVRELERRSNDNSDA